jgi:hypothetical protein
MLLTIIHTNQNQKTHGLFKTQVITLPYYELTYRLQSNKTLTYHLAVGWLCWRIQLDNHQC